MSEPTPTTLDADGQRIPRAQVERLAYIDFRLYFLGELRRSDLIEEFGTGPAGATRDIAQYKELAPGNLEFDSTGKFYLPSPIFKPAFEHAPARVLTALSQGFGHGAATDLAPLLRCEVPMSLSTPRMEVLAPIARAIYRRKPVRLSYLSMTSGRVEREIVPSVLVNNGVRWHVRAFDRKRGKFLDFVFSRMERSAVIEDGVVAQHETAENDDEWNRIVNLELVPHPNRGSHEVIKLEYDMPSGLRQVRLRATMAGYMLRLWNVDCSPDHSLTGDEYRLWLKDPLALYGVESAVMAPGYKSPAGQHNS